MTTFPATLRAWRDRRRLSQLELALRAGTTQRHLSFLETGRSAPGRTMVVRLAESLELPLRERNGLLREAGFAPAYAETPLAEPPLAEPPLAPVRAALRHVIDAHRPYPAILVNRYGDLIAANDAFALLTEGAAAELLAPPVNVYRLALHPAGLAPRIVNLDEWAHHIADRLAAENHRNPDDRLTALLAELTVPERVITPDYVGFAVPMRLRTAHGGLRLMTTVTSFATTVDVTLAELRLEAFLPADEQTAAALATPVKPPGGTGTRIVR